MGLIAAMASTLPARSGKGLILVKGRGELAGDRRASPLLMDVK
jgi:hypothetical protein